MNRFSWMVFPRCKNLCRKSCNWAWSNNILHPWHLDQRCGYYLGTERACGRSTWMNILQLLNAMGHLGGCSINGRLVRCVDPEVWTWRRCSRGGYFCVFSGSSSTSAIRQIGFLSITFFSFLHCQARWSCKLASSWRKCNSASIVHGFVSLVSITAMLDKIVEITSSSV